MKSLFVSILTCIVVTLAAQHRVLTLDPCMKPFYHGIASGDPLTDRVILWTRVTPDSTQTGNSIQVDWRIAADTGMINIINSGTVFTDSSADFTVKIDATGLQPNTVYFYEFTANGYNSIRGRTRTTPAANADSLRFAVVSCANLEAGFFNAYNSLVMRNDFDAVLAIGDYIYEYESGGYSPNPNANRVWEPATEILGLSDYRARYSSYRLDEDLRRLHQQFPFTIVWDDHEFSNDAWMYGAENHQPNEGSWAVRKACGKKAFFEWQPIRQVPTLPTDTFHIYRNFNYGGLLDLIMLDTRIHGRDLQAGTSGSTVTSATRQLLGSDQYLWLKNKLDSSTCQWKILGQQVMVAPLKVFGVAVNGDQWDGYPAQRDSLFNFILGNNISNVVVLTGDIHSSWASDLPTSSYNAWTGSGSAGVEFVTPSVTSPGFSFAVSSSVITAANLHIKYADLTQHGYLILSVSQNRAQSDWYYVATIDSANPTVTYATSYYVSAGQRNVKHSNTPSVPRNGVFYTQAPLCPRASSMGTGSYTGQDVVLAFYPNPVSDRLSLQFFNSQAGQVNIKIFDLQGKLVYQTAFQADRGVQLSRIDTQALAPGGYLMYLQTPAQTTRAKFVKG